MASAPTFGVDQNEILKAEQQRSKWTGCLIGCAVVLGAVLILGALASYLFYKNFRSIAAKFGEQAVGQMLDESNLPDQEKAEIKEQVARVAKAYRENKISNEQMVEVLEKVMKSPLMPAIMVVAVDKQYLDKSGLSAEEKTEGRVSLERFVRGVIDGKIKKEDTDKVMVHLADRQPNNQWKLRKHVSDDELRAALAAAKEQADAAGVAATPEAIDPSEEFKKIIDEELMAPAEAGPAK
jgi:hypothetical protein